MSKWGGGAYLRGEHSPEPPPTRRIFLFCCEFRKSETRPSKLHEVQLDSCAAQRNFPVPRGHAPHPPAPSHKLTMQKKRAYRCGRGKIILYISFQRGSWRSPFETPSQWTRAKHAPGGARGPGARWGTGPEPPGETGVGSPPFAGEAMGRRRYRFQVFSLKSFSRAS